MALLQLEVSERLVAKIGLEALTRKLQQMLELQEVRLMAIEFNEQLKKEGHDQEVMLREAKRRAWQQFKAEKLKEILPS